MSSQTCALCGADDPETLDGQYGWLCDDCFGKVLDAEEDRESSFLDEVLASSEDQ